MISSEPHSPIESLARSVAAYLPVTLVRYILDDEMPKPGRPISLDAATIFADISGFTAMSEELASDGTRGAEELNRVLLVTFTAMLDVIHDLGGAVSHFYGDAMSVYFPDDDGEAALRALSCAQMMQRLMLTSFGKARTNRPPGKSAEFDLTIKIGVGYGRCQEVVVGDFKRSMEFVLTGTAVDTAVEAEKQATAGDIIASRQVIEKSGFSTTQPFKKFNVDMLRVPAQPIIQWETYDQDAFSRLVDSAIPFIPKAINQRLLESGKADIAEHRPVTSLFVQFQFQGDEDNSSSIETATMGQQLQQYYQWAVALVKRFGAENGRVNRVLTGDKGNQLHIMFGAPVAPDAPEQALRCAMAMLREQPDFIRSQRIGISVGKVFAGPVGSSTRREYTVVGDVVNLSARLMQICQDGEILTDQLTVARTRQWIEFEALPPKQLKGKQLAVTPYKLIDDRLASTQIQSYMERWERPLFGRDSEIAQLTQILNQALHGNGGILALTGATGTGKSRLLAYGINHWLEKGGIGLLGLCLQHTMDIPYAPWRSILRDFFGLLPTMSIQEQITSVVEQTTVLAPGSEDDIGLWADPLGLPIPQSEKLLVLTAEARQDRFFSFVKRCFKTAVSRQPMLILLEGLQYADASSLALLEKLLVDIDDMALYIGVSFRPRETFEPNFLHHANCQKIHLSDLSPEHARQILHQLVGQNALPPALEQQLGLRDREGRDSPVNPLFLEEAVNVMFSAGVIERNGDLHIHEELLSSMQLPDTIHGLLLARLDRLPPSERDLLQLASVIGRQFEIDSLTVLAQAPSSTPVIEMLKDLTEADMTHLITADPEWIYLFQHAMTHEVAYESLPYARRQHLHAEVAQWMLAKYEENLRPYFPILAFHYSRAGMHNEALKFSLKAANDAKAIYANKEAVELYTLAEKHLRALGIDERWETAVDLLIARGEVLLIIGYLEESQNDGFEAIKLLEKYHSPHHRSKVYNLLADGSYRLGDYQMVQQYTNITIDELGAEVNKEELAKAYMWAGWAATSQFEYDTALKNLHIGEKIASEINNNERLARILEATSFVYFSQKKLDAALKTMQRSLALSKQFSKPVNIGTSLNNIAYIQYNLGQANESLKTFDEAVEISREYSRNLLANALANRAAVRCYLGHFDDASEDFQEAISIASASNLTGPLLEAYLFMGYEYYCVLEEWALAKDVFEKANNLIGKNIQAHTEEYIRLLIGLVYIDVHTAVSPKTQEMIKEAIEIIEQNDLDWWKPLSHYLLGKIQFNLGEQAEATHSYIYGLETVENGGSPDYAPLLFMELVKLEKNVENKLELIAQLTNCIEERSRFRERLVCLQFAVDYLRNEQQNENDGLFRQLADRRVHLIASFKQKNQASTNKKLDLYF